MIDFWSHYHTNNTLVLVSWPILVIIFLLDHETRSNQDHEEHEEREERGASGIHTIALKTRRQLKRQQINAVLSTRYQIHLYPQVYTLGNSLFAIP